MAVYIDTIRDAFTHNKLCVGGHKTIRCQKKFRFFGLSPTNTICFRLKTVHKSQAIEQYVSRLTAIASLLSHWCIAAVSVLAVDCVKYRNQWDKFVNLSTANQIHVAIIHSRFTCQFYAPLSYILQSQQIKVMFDCGSNNNRPMSRRQNDWLLPRQPQIMHNCRFLLAENQWSESIDFGCRIDRPSSCQASSQQMESFTHTPVAITQQTAQSFQRVLYIGKAKKSTLQDRGLRKCSWHGWKPIQSLDKYITAFL